LVHIINTLSLLLSASHSRKCNVMPITQLYCPSCMFHCISIPLYIHTIVYPYHCISISFVKLLLQEKTQVLTQVSTLRKLLPAENAKTPSDVHHKSEHGLLSCFQLHFPNYFCHDGCSDAVDLCEATGNGLIRCNRKWTYILNGLMALLRCALIQTTPIHLPSGMRLHYISNFAFQ
jgi:hypothetical protein